MEQENEEVNVRRMLRQMDHEDYMLEGARRKQRIEVRRWNANLIRANEMGPEFYLSTRSLQQKIWKHLMESVCVFDEANKELERSMHAATPSLTPASKAED